MLTDLIGIVLAFITVMLLLSLVVMALVQLTQATFRLRGRNLLVGVSALIASQKDLAPDLNPPRSKRRLSPKEHTDHAAEILNATTAAKLRPASDPNSLMNILRGPATSWVDPDDLAAAIRSRRSGKTKAAAATAGAIPVTVQSIVAELSTPIGENDVAAKFRALGPAMSDRFARTMQFWTAVWGVVVAIVFQVSAPLLLHTLSTSQAKRDAVLALVPAVQKQAESTVPASLSDDFVDRALAQLARDPVVTNSNNATEIEARFEQVSGSTDSRQEMTADLRAVLAGIDERDAIVRRYGEIIDATAAHDVNTAISTAVASVDALATIDIRPWGQGGEFYKRPPNVVGVLLRAILLSFGTLLV
jgi:hypothetical protein